MLIGYFLLPLAFMVIGMIVSARLKNRMSLYSQMPLRSGLTGKQVAERMLQEHGIQDVKVVSTGGFLTDHYNPITKTVNLSDGVFNSRSVASAAVAAHEVGHAVQHANAYKALIFRSALVPVTKVGGLIANFAIMAGLYLMRDNPSVLLVGIIAYATTTLFTVVTLPVEFDATRRALVWLDRTGLTYGEEHAAAKDGLRWAALTYVVNALASISHLIWLIMMYNSRR